MPLERAGTEPSRAGPYFLEEIGERTPRGRRFLPLGTPFSGERNGGRWLGRYGPGLRPPRPTPHGPPTSSGGREKWFVDGRRKRETERLFSAFSQRVPTHVPSPPSRWAGRYQRDKERAAGQVLRKKYSLPHTIPPEKGVQREEPLPSGVLSPISSQEMGPRLGKPSSLPFQRHRGKPTTASPGKPAAKTKPPVQESKPTQGVSSSQRSEGPAPPPRACPCSPHAQRRRPAHTAHGEAAGQSPGPRFG